MHEHPNSLLKVGCLLFIVGGLASALVTLAGLLLSVGSMMDSELYPYVDQMARAQSDGLIGGDEIMAVFSGFVFVMGAIAVIMLIIDLTVGILGLSRSRRPEKYRFFLPTPPLPATQAVVGLPQMDRAACSAIQLRDFVSHFAIRIRIS